MWKLWHEIDCEEDICSQDESWSKKVGDGLVCPYVIEIFHYSAYVHKNQESALSTDFGIANRL